MSLFSNKKSFLGVDIVAGGIKMVELRQVKKRQVLSNYGIDYQRQDVKKKTENQV